MKPDWKDAPEWAQYLAMDEEGAWFWYENKPDEQTFAWFPVGGRYEKAVCSDYWQDSLEQRP